MTLRGAHRFIAWYARRCHLDPRGSCLAAGTALYALSRVYQVTGLEVPRWHQVPRTRRAASALRRAYEAYLVQTLGNPLGTVYKKQAHVDQLMGFLRLHGRRWQTMRPLDIDAFLIDRSQRVAHVHVLIYILTHKYKHTDIQK